MKTFSTRSVAVRGCLTVAVAMLVVIDHALNQPQVDLPKIAVAAILAGAIAGRAFLDQSLSLRDKAQDDADADAAAPDVAPVPTPNALSASGDAKHYPYN